MKSPAIELRGVRKSFGNTSVIRDVNLTVVKGERHALIGPNGAGKTTLFNLISGYTKPTAGRILLKDEIVSGLRPYQINRCGLSRSFQVSNVFPNMSVWENIRCALLWATGHRYAFWKNIDNLPEVRERTAQILQDINLVSRRGVAILLVEQKLSIAMRISHRVYVMGHGRIVFNGTPAELKANQAVRREWLEV